MQSASIVVIKNRHWARIWSAPSGRSLGGVHHIARHDVIHGREMPLDCTHGCAAVSARNVNAASISRPSFRTKEVVRLGQSVYLRETVRSGSRASALEQFLCVWKVRYGQPRGDFALVCSAFATEVEARVQGDFSSIRRWVLV